MLGWILIAIAVAAAGGFVILLVRALRRGQSGGSDPWTVNDTGYSASATDNSALWSASGGAAAALSDSPDGGGDFGGAGASGSWDGGGGSGGWDSGGGDSGGGDSGGGDSGGGGGD
jgi:hypothetical protein